MSLWRQVFYGFRSLGNRGKHEREVAEEVADYFEQAEVELQSRGLSAEEARKAARLEGGSIAAAQEQVNAYGWENAIRSFWNDLRFAARQLRKHPLFTAAATLTLAVGIGANAAIFTVVQSVLLAPLPYPEANRLAVLNTYWRDSGNTSPRITGPDAIDVRKQARSLEAVSLYGGGNLGVQLKDHSVYAVVSLVDPEFERVFRLSPLAGHWFGSAQHAAMVGETFAREHFGSPQAALGQLLTVESEPYEITGVLSTGFDFPAQTSVWATRSSKPESETRTAFNYKAVARVRTGYTLTAVHSELSGVSRRLESAYPEDNRNKVIVAQPLQRALTAEARPTLLFLWGTVALILLIACVNVTHLQLVRSMERQRELAIRRALGCSRWQVMQPVILESLLVAMIGGVAGVLLAFPTVSVLVAMAPSELPRATEIHLNGWVVTFAVAISLLTALMSSILPALRAAHVDPAEMLKNDTSRGIGRQGAALLRDGLVIAEVAATFVLVLGAGLLLHTMKTLMDRDMGYQVRRLLVVDADAPAHTEREAYRAIAQFDAIFARLQGVAGVQHVAGIMGLPTGEYGSNGYYETRGGLPVDPKHQPSSVFNVASAGYFQTMGIPLRRGRDFDGHDTHDSPWVAIVSAAFARQSFGDIDPVGKQVQCGLDSDKWMTIVGVVGDVRQASPAESPGPALYMPMTQHPFYANQIHVVVRTQGAPLGLMHATERTIAQVNPNIAMRFTTMDDMVSKSIATERFRATLISVFAGAGLLLAMLGVYGTVAYSVAQRTFELGIRIAFGAERITILKMVLAHTFRLAGYGILLGVVVSALLARLVTSLLVGVSPADPWSVCAAALVLVTTALVAAFMPGWKATHVDPIAALRSV